MSRALTFRGGCSLEEFMAKGEMLAIVDMTRERHLPRAMRGAEDQARKREQLAGHGEPVSGKHVAASFGNARGKQRQQGTGFGERD